MKPEYSLGSGDEHASIHGCCLERDVVAIAEKHILSLRSDGPPVYGAKGRRQMAGKLVRRF